MSPDATPPDRSPDRITPGKALEPDQTISKPPSTFESYMQDAGQGVRTNAPPGSPVPAQGASAPTGIRAPAIQTGGPTFDSLLGQARNVQDGLGTVGQQLQSPNLKLKRSQAHLLKNKLQDTNEYVRSAANKLGVETPPQKTPPGANPIGRFLSYVGSGQDQMMSVEQKLKQLAASNGQIRPEELLFVQVKMSQAQQEIEYSTTLLGKVIDSIKSIMNTQL